MGFMSNNALTKTAVFFPIDIDECLKNVDGCKCAADLAGCTPICINTRDSYDCDCSVGFELDISGLTCAGENIRLLETNYLY